MNAIKEKEFGLDVIYRHDYDKSQEGGNIKKYINESCKHLDKFLNNVPGAEQFSSFIDVGCGNSQAIEYFSSRFADCVGIDKHPQENDERIVKGDFYILEEIFGKNSKDVVFVNHTLEHSLAPLLLEQINKIQRKGGVLFVAVPDADFPWSYNITHSTTHWSIFNEGFLRTILQRYGYEVCVEKKCFRDECGELFAYAIKRWDI